MANNALYFPYIDLPRNRFTNTALLYWDQVITIAPRETAHELASENENNLLIEKKAVRQLHPEAYSNRYPNFGKHFLTLVDQLDLNRVYPNKRGWRGTQGFEATASRIHTAKILTLDLRDELADRGLLVDGRGVWLMVEPITADLFMHYLSQCLAYEDELDCFPVSEERFRFEVPAARHRSAKFLGDHRFHILDRLLPTPKKLLTAGEILDIRSKHHRVRLNFRKSIEAFINNELPYVTDERGRAHLIENFVVRKREEIEEIARQLLAFSDGRWKRIGFASLGFATAAVAAYDLLQGGAFTLSASALLRNAAFGGTIIYAARNAVKDYREGAPELQKDMAFAALLRHQPLRRDTSG